MVNESSFNEFMIFKKTKCFCPQLRLTIVYLLQSVLLLANKNPVCLLPPPHPHPFSSVIPEELNGCSADHIDLPGLILDIRSGCCRGCRSHWKQMCRTSKKVWSSQRERTEARRFSPVALGMQRKSSFCWWTQHVRQLFGRLVICSSIHHGWINEQQHHLNNPLVQTQKASPDVSFKQTRTDVGDTRGRGDALE